MQEVNDVLQTARYETTHKTDLHGPTITTIQTTLPPFVLPSYWRRYSLTLTDINEIMEFLSAKMFWLSVLLHGINASTSSIRPSYGNATEILVSAKSVAMRKLAKYVSYVFPNHEDSIDTKSLVSVDHLPALPFTHEVNSEIMHKLQEHITPSLIPFQVNNVSMIYTFKDRQYIPISTEGDAIYANAIVLLSDYLASGKQQPRGVASVPYQVRYQDQVYALTEEAVLLLTK